MAGGSSLPLRTSGERGLANCYFPIAGWSNTMRISRAILALVICTAMTAVGQQCPKTSTTGPTTASEQRTLEGLLVFHNDIRKWFELKLDQPQCGQKSIQLTRVERDWTQLETLRGCRVRSKGAIDFSPTGYYSLDTYQNVDEIEPVGACKRKPRFPDYSRARPDKTISAYRVEMDVDYEPGDHPIVFHVSRSGKELRPWQAYASYMLTGGFVLYGHCGEGFAVDRVFGTPEAKPSHFTEGGDSEDMATFDPENAAASGKKHLRLGYTCVRTP